jgi:hypothetical protein
MIAQSSGEVVTTVSSTLPPLKVFIDQDGIVQLTAADLATAGWDLTQLVPHTLRLTTQGAEVALWVSGGEDGAFDAGDAVIFYGQAMTSPYTRRNVYWLTAGSEPGLRMAERDAAPVHGYPVATSWRATLHAEQDTAPFGYWQNPPGREAQDHWYWTGPLNAPARAVLPFQMPPFEPMAGAVLRVALAGRSDDPGPNLDHHTRIFLNDVLVSDARWDGQIQFVQTAAVTPTLLAVGTNTITVELPGDTGAAVDSLYVNWLEVDYQASYVALDDRLSFAASAAGDYRFRIGGFSLAHVEAYDTTDSTRPIRLLNVVSESEGDRYDAVFEDRATAATRYLALTPAQRHPPAGLLPDLPSDLRGPAHGADEIILTYDGFYTDTLPLAAHRQTQGLRVQVVRVSDVYDEFSFGLETSQAIRDFLAYAYVNWTPPAPRYVLLVGDANLDYLDRFGAGRPNFVPTLIFDADDVGQTANDTRLAQVAGDDPVPELVVGRLPARSPADVRAMVARLLAYDVAPADPWQSRTLFVADNVPEHEAISEGWTAQIPSGYRLQRVYAGRYPPGDPTADIVAAINRGAALVSYVGHGNIDRWGAWSGGRLFDVAAADRLTNGVRLPLVVTATCLNGFFVHPYSDDTMAEFLVRQADGGAIAAWSPTALGAPGEQAILFESFFDALFGGAPTLGDAIAQAQAAAYRQGVSRELIETFTLFGDPALRLRLTAVRGDYLPVIVRGGGS